MMSNNWWFHRCALGACALAIMAAPVSAQESANYPNRQIRLVVPFAPGGATDIAGRIVAPKLAEELGGNIMIDNRPGVAGSIGVELVTRANPDGYTLLLSNDGAIVINPSIYPKFTVKPLRDLIPIAQVASAPGALVVHESLPVRSVRELIGYAKANPGKLNFASPGTGSIGRLNMETFMRASGIQMVHIPYSGAGPALKGLLGNDVQVMFVSLPSAISFVKSGRLRILGVVSHIRAAATPDIPTMAEQGVPGMKTGAWLGVFAPSGTPPSVVGRLYDATIKAMADPSVTERLSAVSIDVVTSNSPKDFTAFIEAESDRFAKLIKDVGVTAE